MVEGASSLQRSRQGVVDLSPADDAVSSHICLLLHLVNSVYHIRVRQTKTFVIRFTKVRSVSVPSVTIYCTITTILSEAIDPPTSDTITSHAIV